MENKNTKRRNFLILIWVLGVLILLGVSAFFIYNIFYVKNISESDITLPPLSTPISGSADPVPFSGPKMEPGVYTEYSQESIDTAKDVIILFFSEKECIECVSLDDQIIKSLPQIPATVSILKVPAKAFPELLTQYEVVRFPTFIKIRKDKTAIKKWVNSTNLQELLVNAQ